MFPSHRVRTARAAAVAVMVVVATVLFAAGSTATAQAPSTVPEPVLVVEAGATDGQVSLMPATQSVSHQRLTWVLRNGGEEALAFDLAIHDVVATGGAVEVGAERVDLPLAQATVRLAGGEAARIPLLLPDATSPDAIALVARSVDADPETTVSGIALLGGAGGNVTARLARTDVGTGTFTVRLDSDFPTLVDVAVRASAWPGLMSTEDVIEGVFVPAGGRDLDVSLDGAMAGRLQLDVAVSGDTPVRASADVWWWPAEVVVALLAIVLLIVVAITGLRRRRQGDVRGTDL